MGLACAAACAICCALIWGVMQEVQMDTTVAKQMAFPYHDHFMTSSKAGTAGGCVTNTSSNVMLMSDTYKQPFRDKTGQNEFCVFRIS